MQSYRTPFAATFRAHVGGRISAPGTMCRVKKSARAGSASRALYGGAGGRSRPTLHADGWWEFGEPPVLHRSSVFCRSVSSWGRRSVWGQTLELCRRCGGTMAMMRPPSSRPNGRRDSIGRQPIARGGGGGLRQRGADDPAGRGVVVQALSLGNGARFWRVGFRG